MASLYRNILITATLLTNIAGPSTIYAGSVITQNGAQSPPDGIAEALQKLIVEHKASAGNVTGEALSVAMPAWRWSGATGYADSAGEPLTARHVFRIASVTKPFTAATILRLMEQGKIDIESPITRYIAPVSADVLRRGGYNPDHITVQQLLSHTSGIYDYATDANFNAQVMADPGRQWTRIEQINLAMSSGKPMAAPGEIYAYSDTGYVLLGEIIERLTGQGLAPAVRKLLRFERLGLRDTYWEQFENRKSKAPFAGNHLGDADLTHANPSFDLFGGGGIISSVSDLTTFYRALVRGDVFDRRSTLAVMMTTTGARRAPSEPGVATNAVRLIPVGRWKCWGHGGFWGQQVVHCPEIDMTFAWTINQAKGTDEARQKFINDLAKIAAP